MPDAATSPPGAATTTPPRLRVRDVSVGFGAVQALAGVSVEVAPRAILGIVGGNAAGKTTLLDVICGRVQPDAGAVELDGEPLAATPKTLTRLGIARTMQDPSLIDSKSVVDNILRGTAYAPRTGVGFLLSRTLDRGPRRDDRQIREYADVLMKDLDLLHHAHDKAAAVPYAIKRRITLAQALIDAPRLVLLDEPAAGLGGADLQALGRVIRTLPRRGECSVVLVEHRFELVLDVCDQVVVLDGGKVIATGTPEEIRASPAVAAAYWAD